MYQSLIHRRQSRRLNGYDYSKAGAYFITICTADKQPFFGTIKSGELCSTTTVIIAKNVWEQIPIQFPFVELDEFVVMPDHIHGILIIDDPVGAGSKNRRFRRPSQSHVASKPVTNRPLVQRSMHL